MLQGVENWPHAKLQSLPTAPLKLVGLSTRLDNCELILESFVNVSPGQGVQLEGTRSEVRHLSWGNSRDDQAVCHIDTELVTTETARGMATKPSDQSVSGLGTVRLEAATRHSAVDEGLTLPYCIDPRSRGRDLGVGPV